MHAGSTAGALRRCCDHHPCFSEGETEAPPVWLCPLPPRQPLPAHRLLRGHCTGDSCGSVSPSIRWGDPQTSNGVFLYTHTQLSQCPYLCGLKTGQNSQRQSRTPKPARQRRSRCQRAGLARKDAQQVPCLPLGASREEGSPGRWDQEGILELGSTMALSGCTRLVMGSFTPLCSQCVGEPLTKGHDSGHAPPAGTLLQIPAN